MKQTRDSVPALSREKKSLVIARTLEELPLYRKARTVMYYLSFGSEVITGAMIERALIDGKNVVVPFLDKSGKKMGAAKINSIKNGLTTGAYGIREPEPALCKRVLEGTIDMVVVPAIAYDLSCNRIGYGKGYYDRWLKKIPVSARVGVAYDLQIVREIPKCPDDLPLGLVVTEKRIIRPGNTGRKCLAQKRST